MTPEFLALLTLAVLVVAFLYSSAGHAGASGYIAVMSLFNMAPAEIKSTALVLNILVATIGSWQFWRAGHFSWKLFWPFALLSIPSAFVGGYLNLPTYTFKVLVGIVLLFSAMRFMVHPPAEEEPQHPSKPLALGVGAGLGLLSGLTGTGGGIFLTPLVIFMHWARTKTASAVSALFILVNSVSGLLGNISATQSFPAFALPLAAAVVCGGTIGAYLGSRRLPHNTIKRLLAVVLTIAGLKLIFLP
ncbi:MAG TPA: sulfite exporter TauE/SafE family protein [Thermodesulfobacteriota bacterium]|nr:sulfite exporter TauE/SafE family protein [Thermodesulfobacteriota bacterium]